MITTLAGAPARPLGLAAYPEQQRACVRVAHAAGVNFFFFYSISHESLIDGLAPVLRRARDDVIVATGSGSRNRKGLERARRAICRRLGVETLDVFFAEYVSPSDDFPRVFDDAGVLDLLCEWRETGAIRYVGASAHDRDLARRLVDDGRVDVLMHRFNMAHRKAAASVFPAAEAAGIPVVAFTATRWRTLLDGHPDWSGPVPSAADCYRYCLAAPAVQVVLSAPATIAQLRANLTVLQDGRADPSATADWDAYGDLVYAAGRGRFETMWP
ncbi:MAG: aldo/keto reductase [Acidobacteria bacterium]|nr:aldo/keto reductase [Acidobacteriota bacterium]